MANVDKRAITAMQSWST